MIKLMIAGAVLALFVCAENILAAELPTAAEDRQTILAVDARYIKAFNAKDIAAVMQSFADDAVYVTDYGETLHGKDEIQNALQKQFKETGDSTLELKVYAVDFSADKQRAIEHGVSVVTIDGIKEPSSYVAEYSRQGDQWRVSKVVEEPEATSAEHLRDLAWMIGDWIDKSEDASVRTKSEWTLDRGFITRKFAVTTPGQREMKGIEYIGWDPTRKEIHSWYFDSDGGYGGGRWRRDGKRWMVEAVGITPDGDVASATHIFTPKDTDTFTWSSVNRKVGDEPQADVPETTIQRLKGEQPTVEKGPL